MKKATSPRPHPYPGLIYPGSFLQFSDYKCEVIPRNQKRQQPGNVDAWNLIPGVPLSTIWPWEILPLLWASFLSWEVLLASKGYPCSHTSGLQNSAESFHGVPGKIVAADRWAQCKKFAWSHFVRKFQHQILSQTFLQIPATRSMLCSILDRVGSRCSGADCASSKTRFQG